MMEVKLESKADYVLTTFTGPLSLPKLHQAIHESIDAAADSGLNLILFDWSRVEGILTTAQRLEIGEIGAAHVRTRIWKSQPKIAVVGRFPGLNGLAAVVATNRGFSAQTFLNVQEALDWFGIAPRTEDGIPPGIHN
jgi:hypothetical protein